MKKMLMLASVASMIDQFNMPNIQLLQEMGYEVHVACNFEKGSTCSEQRISDLKKRLMNINVRFFQIDFSRNILNIQEILRAYKQVRALVCKENYSFIHCHSPIGGAIGRLVGHSTHTKVIYTAHGFHFYKGASLINWLLYYPIEKWLSRYTDILITINKEDYQRAKRKFHAKETRYIPGVGIDVKKIQAVHIDRDIKREQLGVGKNDFVMLSVGELNKNKNHEIVIRALSQLNNPQIKYIICGQGALKGHLEKLAEKLGVRQQLVLLGFREDIIEIYKSADIFVFPSKREGLSVALMEALACGTPCIVSDIRGNKDLIVNGVNGYICNIKKGAFAKAILKMVQNEKEFKQLSCSGFGLKKINDLMKKIYIKME